MLFHFFAYFIIFFDDSWLLLAFFACWLRLNANLLQLLVICTLLLVFLVLNILLQYVSLCSTPQIRVSLDHKGVDWRKKSKKFRHGVRKAYDALKNLARVEPKIRVLSRQRMHRILTKSTSIHLDGVISIVRRNGSVIIRILLMKSRGIWLVTTMKGIDVGLICKS